MMISFNSIYHFKPSYVKEVATTSIKLLNQRESQAVRRWEGQRQEMMQRCKNAVG